MRVTFTAICLATWLIGAAAAVPPKASPVTPQAASTQSPANPSPNRPDDRRVDALEAQFNLVREYNDDFLSVIIWSLSSIGTMMVVLIGLNWFQSNRALKKEFEALQRDLAQTMGASQTNLEAKIHSKLRELEKSVNKVATSAAREQMMSIKPRILELESKAHEEEYERWMAKAIFPNALRAASELLECSIEINWDWQISDALEKVHSALDGARKSNEQLEIQALAELESVVERVPDSNKTARLAMLKKLAGLHPK